MFEIAKKVTRRARQSNQITRGRVVICNFLKTAGSPQADMTTKQRKRSCLLTSSKNETTAVITLPKPTSCKYYTKPEMVEVLAGYPDRKSSIRANAIKEIIDNEYGLCTSMTIYRILNAHKNGEAILDTEWSKAGRPRLVGKKILAPV